MMNKSIWQRVLGSSMLLALGGCAASVDESSQHEATGSTTQALNSARWQGWSQVPNGTGLGSPALTTRGTNAGSLPIDLYIQGGDTNIWYNYWSPMTGWLGYAPIGSGRFLSSPAATNWGNPPRNAAVAGLGLDYRFYISIYRLNQAWTGWQQIPSSIPFDGAPALSKSSNGNKLYAFGKLNYRMYWASNDVSSGVYNNAAWSTWTEVPGGGTWPSAPAATVNLSTGKVELVAQGLDGAVWINEFDGSSWTGWSQISGYFHDTVQPAVSSWTNFHVDVFEKNGGTIFANSRDYNTWSGYSPIPTGVLTSGVGVVSRGSGQLDVIGRGTDNRYYWNQYR